MSLLKNYQTLVDHIKLILVVCRNEMFKIVNSVECTKTMLTTCRDHTSLNDVSGGTSHKFHAITTVIHIVLEQSIIYILKNTFKRALEQLQNAIADCGLCDYLFQPSVCYMV